MNRNTLSLFVLVAAALLLAASPALAGDDSELEPEAESESESDSDSDSAPASAADISVIDAKVAASVEDREPVDASDSFTTGDTVTLWMAINNPSDAADITVKWQLDGNDIHSFDLNIGTSSCWRTWATMNVGTAGDWSAEIQDAGGNTLNTVAFTVAD